MRTFTRSRCSVNAMNRQRLAVNSQWIAVDRRPRGLSRAVLSDKKNKFP